METARLWSSLGHHDRHGVFHIDGVTGPDEYTAVADDNVYTNLMAQRNLLRRGRRGEPPPGPAPRSSASTTRRPRLAGRRGGHERPVRRRARRAPAGPRVHPPEEWDFENTAPEQYPLLLHFPYFDLYRKQVVKQADLVLAMHWRGDAFTAEQKSRNFAYYERADGAGLLAVGVHPGGLAAEVGHLELAHDYLRRGGADRPARPAPQHPRRRAHRFAGRGLDRAGRRLRRHARPRADPDFAPRLPGRITRLEFSVLWRGLRLQVRITAEEVTYNLVGADDDASLEIRHHGEKVVVTGGQPVTCALPEIPTPPVAPRQPPGRAPLRRNYSPDFSTP